VAEKLTAEECFRKTKAVSHFPAINFPAHRLETGIGRQY
jgi:hypothetical protein